MVSPTFTAAGNTDASRGSGNNIVIGTLKAAGVHTMSGVGYLADIESENPVPPGMREVDGLSRWLDGVVNEQVGDNGENQVERDGSREAVEKGFEGFGIEGLPEELGKTVNRRSLYKIEGGDIPGQLLLALLPPALQTAEDEQGLVGSETGEEQGEGSGGDSNMGREGMESIEDLGASELGGSSMDNKDAPRYHALGNAVVPQQIYPILEAIADIELL